MDGKLYAQGLTYKSCWIVAIADSNFYTPTVLTADGRLLTNGKLYATVAEAIAAGRHIVELRSQKTRTEDDVRWID